MTASFKFDDAQSYPTQCFPARTSPLRRKRQGGGHWLVAYRKAEEENYRNLYKKVKEAYKKQSNNEITESPGGRTLDRDLLLRLHCADEPFELSFVDISEQYLNAVKDEDFYLFDNVIHIDASINFLSLAHFSSFKSLREINLSLNRLQDMTFDPAHFPNLQVLDLSYNSLSVEAVAAIGRLLRLRVLHLTGNQLNHLPPDLSSSNQGTTQMTEEDTNFKSLEVLMLDDNKLSNGVFSSLAKLKRLKYLNLQGNLISEVPLLEMIQYLPTSAENKEADENTDNLMKLLQILQLKDWEEYKESSFPFPELQFLHLSGNKIAVEEALLAVALFPKLCEIDISANPLTTQRSGDPPLLTHYLQDKLGVKIKRKDEPEVKTFPNVSLHPKRKVKACDKVPKILKKTQKTEDDPEDDVASHLETKEMFSQLSFDQNNGLKTCQPFFVTETLDDIELDFQTPIKEFAENQDSFEDLDNFTSYKSLTEVKPDFGADVEPIGIQTAVRMLEHTLKNLNVYRDSKPKLDSIQTPYREHEKRIKPLPAPPAQPLQQQNEKLDKIIEEIKQSRTMREIPLTKVMKKADVKKQDYKEAVSLLKDMKVKYKMVHRKTMVQASNLRSEKNTLSNKLTPLVQHLDTE